MPSRFEFERRVIASDLPAPTRHILLTIATWADNDSGAIPPRFTPSIGRLQAATGMSRAAICKHLNAAEEAGWLDRYRPAVAKARAEHARTLYVLAMPGLVRQEDQPWSTTETSSSPPGGPNHTGHSNNPPNPPQAGGTRRCTAHRRPRRGCPDCAVTLAPVPDWCGECDHPDTRLIETPAGMAKCPACHISTVRGAS